jgi:ribosome-binding factor A
VKEFDRTERIGTALQRELVEILRDQVKDPRLKRVTIQEARVSRDLSHAKVYFTCFPLDEGAAEQASLLNGRLAGFLRTELAHRMRLRTVPQLKFVHDESIAHGEHIDRLIDEAVAAEQEEDATNGQDQGSPEA